MTTAPRRLLAAGATALLASVAALPAAAQTDTSYDVLMFHNAAGFVHASIPAAIAGFQALAVENGFTVTATADPAVFTDDNLAQYEVVAFVLTTAEAVPDVANQEAFERWHAAGGAWLGVHSAADTEYDWPYYGELLAGGYFLNHPVNQPGTAIVEVLDHPATAHLGETWSFPLEEFYSFQRSVRGDATVLVSMDEDSYDQDPNTTNLPDSPTFPDGLTGVMGDHPMVWCHDVGGGRAFYTAFGHQEYLYADPDFRAHILGALESLAGLQEADCFATRVTDVPQDDGDDAGATDDGSAEGGGSLAATGGGAALLATGLLAVATRTRRRRRA